jgi:hypothetical protein
MGTDRQSMIDRSWRTHGTAQQEAFNALHSIMCELDAARVVVARCSASLGEAWRRANARNEASARHFTSSLVSRHASARASGLFRQREVVRK